MSPASCTLLICTYNWPEALELVLLSVLNQSRLPDEVVIADDGSGAPTRELIEAFARRLPMPLIHVWQEDDGHRKASALNKALARASGEYVVQIDGDCILHRHFVADHLAAARPGCYLYGSRVNIQESRLASLFADKTVHFGPFSRGISKRGRALHWPALGRRYKPSAAFSRSKFRGCNCSYWRADAIEVNGYNEAFTGWGWEDSEFAIRLHNIGRLGRRLRYQGIVFHIWHPERDKSHAPVSDEIEQATSSQKRQRCELGLDQYLDRASPAAG